MVIHPSNDAYVRKLFRVVILLTFNIKGCALKFRNEMDNYVMCDHDLRHLEMDEEEWLAITQVADWLRVFQLATTQMSATKQASVLSMTHAVFRGLQEHLLSIFRALPANTPQNLTKSLLDAYHKLSDYYYKFDQSPFYCWAACKFYDS